MRGAAAEGVGALPGLHRHIQRLWAKMELDEGQLPVPLVYHPQMTGMTFPNRGSVPISGKFYPAVAVKKLFFIRCCKNLP